MKKIVIGILTLIALSICLLWLSGVVYFSFTTKDSPCPISDFRQLENGVYRINGVLCPFLRIQYKEDQIRLIEVPSDQNCDEKTKEIGIENGVLKFRELAKPRPTEEELIGYTKGPITLEQMYRKCHCECPWTHYEEIKGDGTIICKQNKGPGSDW